MNVELVPDMSSDYLDLNLFSNKHSALRLGRHKPPPFAVSRLHQLLIGLFSPADETSLTERKAMSKKRFAEGGLEEGTEGGRQEKSLLMILRFNYFCKYRKLGLLGDSVSRFFISRAVVRCLGPASRLAE